LKKKNRLIVDFLANETHPITKSKILHVDSKSMP
jgi:hypothetical protein